MAAQSVYHVVSPRECRASPFAKPRPLPRSCLNPAPDVIIVRPAPAGLQGRAGRRAPPPRGGLPEAKRRGRARSRREGLEAELQRLDLGAEAAAPTGTGLVYDDAHSTEGEPKPLSVAWAALEELGLVQRCVRVECRPATDEELLLLQSPTLQEQMEQQRPPPAPPGLSLALGSLLELQQKVLSGDLRNGLVLLRPPQHSGPGPTSSPIGSAARAAQRHGLQRILIVDWSPQPGRAPPQLFQEDPG
ncbi:polyamine deacetylase HDAC10-like [Strigops habroptila]|uniref:polyamine deacetylase HDAC10-like n=1 Tax=Strigops habroptila TaxID=2489341 RepID=UPI0011CFB76B|nr:polyamine deacetylase HDAC10-like [Strigops habroptila]